MRALRLAACGPQRTLERPRRRSQFTSVRFDRAEREQGLAPGPLARGDFHPGLRGSQGGVDFVGRLAGGENGREASTQVGVAAAIAVAVAVAAVLVANTGDSGESSTVSPSPGSSTDVEPAAIDPPVTDASTDAGTDTGSDGGNETGDDTSNNSGSETGDTVSPDPAAVALRQGGSVEVGTTLNFDDPNPHSNLDVAPLVAGWVLPVMYRIDDDLDAIPSLATGPPVATDGGLTLTWSIHADQRWDDGTPVTTADIVATYEYLTADDTSASNTTLYDSVTTVEATDPTTLRIGLSEPQGAAYLMFSTIHPIMKDAAWRDHLASGATAATFLVDGIDFAAGPYQLAARQNPGEVALARNPAWSGDTTPALDRLSFASYPDGDALIEAQTSGQVDVIWVDDVTGSEILDIADLPDTEVLVDDSSVAVQLSLNLQSEPLQDPLVRRAVLHAIDREVIVDTAVGRKTATVAEPWNSLVFATGQRGDEQPFAASFDVAEANRLLDEAGWLRPSDDVFRRKNGQDLALTIVLAADSDSINTAIAIENSLQALGIDVTGTPASAELTNERMESGAFDLLLQFRLFNNDPIATSLSFGTAACPSTIDGCTGDGVNFGAFSDAGVDAALDLADITTDPTARLGVYTGIDRQLAELVPAIPLYVEPSFTA